MSGDSAEAVVYERKGSVRILTLNRPDQLNAVTFEMEQLLEQYTTDFRTDDSAQVLVVAGAGRAFCAGMDLKSRGEAAGTDASRAPRGLHGAYAQELFKPVIAALHGYVIGAGLELALACDIRIAAQSARFAFPEARRGLIPGMGGTQLLPRSMPMGQAMWMLLTGDTVDAAEAYRVGLVQQVVSTDEAAVAAAVQLAERLSASAPLALRAIKEAVMRGLDMDRRAGMLLERDACFRIATTNDYVEGRRAFVEKREPEYRGG